MSSAEVGALYVGFGYSMDMSTIGSRIRRARKHKGLTQQAVASHFGIQRVSVTQWESDTTTPESDKFQKLAELLGGSAEWYLTGSGEMPTSDSMTASVSNPSANAKVGEKVREGGRRIPVYGQAVGGQDGEFDMNGNILYEVMCPPSISPIADAYGVNISGDSMEPRYFDGETAFVDPTRRVRRGDFVVAQIQFEDNGAPLAYVKRFVRHTNDELVLEQFNPPKELRFPHKNVVSVHYIAMAGSA